MARIFRKNENRVVGTSGGGRRYDLPLREDAGTRYLMLLIGLMTFLTLLALSASFALNTLSERWTTGLENKMTVELPARQPNGDLLSRQETDRIMQEIARTLSPHPAVSEIRILSDEDITKLVEPWLGEDALARDMPIPGLASLTLTGSGKETVDVIRRKIRDIAPQARLDTHKDWMTDLLKFTGTLNALAVIIVAIIGFTMLAAVAGGVRSRMAVHKDEVKLLHLMGAPDSYISGQFQKHALILSFKGALAGAAAAFLALLIFGWITGRMNMGLLPDFDTTLLQKVILGLVPVLVAALSAVTARRTVESALNALP